MKFLVNPEKAVLFFCNGVVLVVSHFNSETRHCQGSLKSQLLLFVSDSNLADVWVFFLFQEKIYRILTKG